MSEPTMNMLRCPKCPGVMRTYERNGVTVEQCDSCRGIFLDFGELEALTRMEGQYAGPPQGYPPQQAQPYPPQYPPQPGWGGGHGYGHGQRRHRGFSGLFYSS
jgi:Zn-finger nucleic acid-binding protein